MSDEPISSGRSIAVHLALAVDKIGQLTSEVSGLRQEFRDWKKESREDFLRMETSVDNKLEGYVSKDAFEPVKLLVYGLVGTVGVSVIGAVMYLIMHIPTP